MMRMVHSLSAPTAPLAPARTTVERLQGTIWERFNSAQLLYRIINAIAVGLSKLGVTANAITYVSLLGALGSAFAAARGMLLTAALLLLASGILDLLDGAVARTTGKTSAWGALLDSTCDRVADALPLAGLVVLYAKWGWSALIPVVAILGGFLISYVRARSEGLGKKLPQLLMRRAERVLVIITSLALGGIGLDRLHIGCPLVAPLTLVGIAVLAVLNVAGLVAVLRAARRTLLSEPPPAQTEVEVAELGVSRSR